LRVGEKFCSLVSGCVHRGSKNGTHVTFSNNSLNVENYQELSHNLHLPIFPLLQDVLCTENQL